MIVNKIYNAPVSLDAVILIDCWDYTNYPNNTDKVERINNFYQNLVSHIKQLSIKRIIDASTHLECNQFDTYLYRELCQVAPIMPLQTLDEFLDFCQRSENLHLKNWYVAGQAWGLCAHHNHIGLQALGTKTQGFGLNFYSDLQSFLCENGCTADHTDYSNDVLKWDLYASFGYKLVSQTL